MAGTNGADVQPNDLPGLADKVALGSRFTTILKIANDPAFPEYAGEVEARYPSTGDLIAIEVRMTRMLGGYAPEQIPQAAYVARMIATLAVIVQKAPAWWYVRDELGGGLIPAPELCKSADVLTRLFTDFSGWSDNFFRRGSESDQGVGAAPKEPSEVDHRQDQPAASVQGGVSR